jgi:HK97 family phage portal protein
MSNFVSKILNSFIKKRQSFADHLYQQNYAFNSDSESGETVTVDRGSKISTVFTCVNTIAQDIAKISYNVIREVDGVKTVEKKNPVYRLIHNAPNKNTTAFNFWYSIMWSALTKGNGIALIIRDKNQIPIEFIQLDGMNPRIIQEDGDLFYSINDSKVVPSRDILHFKMYSFDGIIGVSPITYNAQVMGYKLKQEKYSAKVIGTKGSGFISSEGLTPEQGKEVAQGIKAALADGSIPFIGAAGRTTWNQQLITPNEGQYIETRYQTNTEIYGIYRMPPSFAQNYERATYANASQQDMVYVKHTLTPWLRMIEQECDSKLFSEANKVSSNPFFTKFNVNSILRGDIQARADYYKTMKDGIMTTNEIRKLEDLPPVPEGNVVQMQGAMIPLGTIPNEKGNVSFEEKK